MAIGFHSGLTQRNYAVSFVIYGGRNKKWQNLEEVQEEILDQEKCIKQFALNVAKNAKFHSNLQKVEMFFARNVFQNEEENFNSVSI